ncbi:MAG: hypothetical protein U0271_13660 [Polyangiaceae bacterium]
MMQHPTTKDPHLGDDEVAAIADGELHLLGRGRLEHFEGCEDCASRVAEQALLAFEVTRALRETSPELARAAARASITPKEKRRSAVLAALAGTAVALLASIPSVVSWLTGPSPELALRMWALAARQAVSAIGRHAAGPIWTLGVAMVLVAAGVAIAWRTRRETSTESQS